MKKIIFIFFLFQGLIVDANPHNTGFISSLNVGIFFQDVKDTSGFLISFIATYGVLE